MSKEELGDHPDALLGSTDVRAIGMKPRPDDTDVHMVRIEGTDLVIRMWEGAMNPYTQFSPDFFDTRQQLPVNLPPGYSIHPGLPMCRELSSWDLTATPQMTSRQDGRAVATFIVPFPQSFNDMFATDTVV
ncbi:hypothetical protein C8Q80DRAFT_1267713 [Daedaleopsis nitida]|nr:hypothetical protein C8Q80DRAFT_1267713 [Daedaleopsis nitida]